ncbi:hypothetical protein A3Q56_02897 [Intoshia linei]|uniref:Calponin-homology (CH) domain-containing protein n=1 Tax=Intoshia linei TaxID=1819745 RepID=A0A177B4Y5_9BILA|nr:hypothetical protein A3Q56_02897 [Intoshia linei]
METWNFKKLKAYASLMDLKQALSENRVNTSPPKKIHMYKSTSVPNNLNYYKSQNICTESIILYKDIDHSRDLKDRDRQIRELIKLAEYRRVENDKLKFRIEKYENILNKIDNFESNEKEINTEWKSMKHFNLMNNSKSIDNLHNLDTKGLNSLNKSMNVLNSFKYKILKMEENHNCTNEELQATLKELSDLQTKIKTLSKENNVLIHERTLILDTLSNQTTNLDSEKFQNDQLKSLLIRNVPEVKCDLNEKKNSIEWFQQREKMFVDIIKYTKDENRELKHKFKEYNDIIENLNIKNTFNQKCYFENENNNTNLKYSDKSNDVKLYNLNQLSEYVEFLLNEKKKIIHENVLLQSSINKLCKQKENIKRINNSLKLDLHIMSLQKKQLHDQINSSQNKLQMERQEWEAYQRDLLSIVVIANNFRTESDIKLLKKEHEISELQALYESEKNTVKYNYFRNLNKCDDVKHKSALPVIESSQKIESNHKKIKPNKIISVKNIIASIEDQTIQKVYSNPTFNVDSNLKDSTTDVDLIKFKDDIDESHQTIKDGANSKISHVYDYPIKNYIFHANKVNKDKVYLSYDHLHKDPLSDLLVNGGSRRNALLSWCKQNVINYKNVEITNFSSSWNDGIAFCYLLHSIWPECINLSEISDNHENNFKIAFSITENMGIESTLCKTDEEQSGMPP